MVQKKINRTIYQDQRIAEEFCNFKCDYCEGFYPTDYCLNKDMNGNLKVADEWYDKIDLLPVQAKNHFRNSRTMEDFYDLALNVIENSKNILYADILKISGGEITTNKKLFDFVKKIHKKYSYIQILTNGFNLTEKEIKEYKKLGNINFQISIDGVTEESNYAKSHSVKVTERVLKNIEFMIKSDIGVEINCVLTKYNTDKFLEFLEKFKDCNNFIIIPRPVRGEPKETLNFSKKQIIDFEKVLIENFEKYVKILPPKAYIMRLIEIMKQDKRSTSCYIPFFVQSIDGYGNLEECPIGLITEKTSNIFELHKKEDIKYKCFKENNLCKNCTNQYEMFNLYVEGKITKEELRKMPSLNSDKIVKNIDEIKVEIIENELALVLKERYNIEVEKIEKNEQSTDGNVYIAYSNKEKYAIKIYNEINHTKSMVKLHKKLSSLNFNIPNIIPTNENNYYEKILDTNYCVIYSFVNGTQIGWNVKTGKLDNETITAIAKLLRRFHNDTNINEFDLPSVPFENKNKRQSALHFDLTRNNIFRYNNGEIGFIDFDDAKYGSSVCDIAILIANLFFSKTRGVDMQGMKKFIDEYYCEDTQLKNEEEPLIKDYAQNWINYILDGNEFDTSTTESFEVRKKLINENL
ncbi:MAG: radical SAM protein [Clostridia bacterium]|nr:radical SAM protein [Clostridia bacterium]